MAQKDNDILRRVAGICAVIVGGVVIGWGTYVTEKASKVDGVENYGIETRKWNLSLKAKQDKLDERIYENNKQIGIIKKDISGLHKGESHGGESNAGH